MYNYKYDEFSEEKVPRVLKDEMGDRQGIRKESDRTPRSERGEAVGGSSGREQWAGRAGVQQSRGIASTLKGEPGRLNIITHQ